MNRIVVGVDGSGGALGALRWAVAEARLRGACLDVLHAWTYPTVIPTAIGVVPPMPRHEELAESASSVVTAALKAFVAELEGVETRPLTVEGFASKELIRAAKGADLLVVGSRGRGGFVGLLLGSVSQQCAHHAPCPLVIVPSH